MAPDRLRGLLVEVVVVVVGTLYLHIEEIVRETQKDALHTRRKTWNRELGGECVSAHTHTHPLRPPQINTSGQRAGPRSTTSNGAYFTFPSLYSAPAFSYNIANITETDFSYSTSPTSIYYKQWSPFTYEKQFYTCKFQSVTVRVLLFYLQISIIFILNVYVLSLLKFVVTSLN